MPAIPHCDSRRLPPVEPNAVTDTMSKWQAAESALTPIIGRDAFVALYRRSLHLALSDYPWLAAAEAAPDARVLERLQTVLSHQPLAIAVAANDYVFACFVEQLTHLLGKALTERLLAPPSASDNNPRAAG
jgi:hypothetical protein